MQMPPATWQTSTPEPPPVPPPPIPPVELVLLELVDPPVPPVELVLLVVLELLVLELLVLVVEPELEPELDVEEAPPEPPLVEDGEELEQPSQAAVRTRAPTGARKLVRRMM